MKRTVSVIAEEADPACPAEPRGPHCTGDFAELCTILPLAELRQVVETDALIAADEEVEVTVAVVVGETAAGRPATAGDTDFFGDVGEGRSWPLTAEVAVEMVALDAGDVEILKSVAVVVRDTDADPPAGIGDAGLFGDVDEGWGVRAFLGSAVFVESTGKTARLAAVSTVKDLTR